MNETVKEFTYKYKICDAHAHIFPDKIAEKATSAIGNFYNIKMSTVAGSVEELKKSGNNIGVSKYLVCSTATTAHQVESINEFIINACASNPEFVGFGTLHPEFKNIPTQVDYCLQNGLKGIKLHPDFQAFNIDDKSAYPIYEEVAGKIPILFHIGDNRYDFSSPARLKKVLSDFPKLTAFAAHFGGYRKWKESAELFKDQKNIFFDTSSSLPFISKEEACNLIKTYGAERMFFGCDFPMWQHSDEIERFMSLNLSDTENKIILSENFDNFFK